MSDDAGPSNEHENVVEQFTNICGVDASLARLYLRQTAWDLEIAVQEYFVAQENGTAASRPAAAPRQEAAVGAAINAAEQQQQHNPNQVVPLRQNASGGFSNWLQVFHHYLVVLPLRIIYSSVTNVLTFLYILLGNPPSLPVTNPREDVRHFLEDVVDRHPGRDHVSFVSGSYDEAVRRAKRNVQCLLVYLHASSPQCDECLRDYVLTERFGALLQRNDALLWGVVNNSGEGKRAALQILRLSGPQNVLKPAIFNILQSAFDENRPHLATLIREKKAQEQNSALIREQEAEYARSLAADKAKRDAQLQREAQRAEHERVQRAEAERVATKRHKLAEVRERVRAALSAQPTPLLSAADKGKSAEIVCVRMKFPVGSTHTWSFDRNASLEELFNVVLAHEHCPSDFSLVFGYPSSVLNCAPEWYAEFSESTTVLPAAQIPTFAQAGFERTAVVLVRDNQA